MANDPIIPIVTATETAAKVVSDAVETAKNVVAQAQQTASDLADNKRSEDEQTTIALTQALRDVFGENQKAQRFIDVSRIPLICKSIYDIHDNIKEIKEMIKEDGKKYVNQDQFEPIKKIVYGLTAAALMTLLAAVLRMVIK